MRRGRIVRSVIAAVGLLAATITTRSAAATITAGPDTTLRPGAAVRAVLAPRSAGQGIVRAGLRRGSAGGPCGTTELYEIRAGGRFLGCTHGPDPAPAGIDVRIRRSTAELRARTPAVPASVPCVGDGVSGNRVQAMYIHASDVTDRYAQVAPMIQTWAAGVNDALNASAAETKGKRQVRFVTPGCQLSILDVQIGAAADDDFASTIDALRTLGYTASNRKYLAWVDANVYCGVGQLNFDDQPGQANLNNGAASIQGMVARIDNACWGELSADGAVESHELMHTLGAVQLSSPNHSAYNHCNDEYEVMCYQDGSPGLVLHYPCPIDHDRLYDCGHNDYFSTSPPGGSYLATHWNTASSSFLISTVTPANDSFAAAEPLAATRGAWVGSNVGATQEPGEPNPTGTAGTHSVWYRIDVPVGATVLTIDTQTSTFDTVVGVYTGSSVNALTLVAANDDAATGVKYSRLSASVTGGASYVVEVNGNGTATGSLTLHIGTGGLAPVITSVSPTAAAVGKQVVLTGSHFFGGAYAYLRFNGVYPAQADYVSYSDTRIVMKVPAGSFSGPISVITEYGQAQMDTPFHVKPSVTAFAPTSGSPGTQVVITGSAFLDASKVTFGGAAATTFTLDAYGQITAVVPTGAVTGKIAVFTPAGQGQSAQSFAVT